MQEGSIFDCISHWVRWSPEKRPDKDGIDQSFHCPSYSPKHSQTPHVGWREQRQKGQDSRSEGWLGGSQLTLFLYGVIKFNARPSRASIFSSPPLQFWLLWPPSSDRSTEAVTVRERGLTLSQKVLLQPFRIIFNYSRRLIVQIIYCRPVSAVNSTLRDSEVAHTDMNVIVALVSN